MVEDRPPVRTTTASPPDHLGEPVRGGPCGRRSRRANKIKTMSGRPAAQKLALMIGSQRNGGELLAAWLSRPIWMPRSTRALLKMPMLTPR